MAMVPNPVPSFRRMKRLLGLFVRSQQFRPAALLFLVILLLLAGQTGLKYFGNLTNNRVFTAIEHHELEESEEKWARWFHVKVHSRIDSVPWRPNTAPQAQVTVFVHGSRSTDAEKWSWTGGLFRDDPTDTDNDSNRHRQHRPSGAHPRHRLETRA